MKLHDRLLLDNIREEIHFTQESYFFGEQNDYVKMRDHFERLEKLVSLLELSMRGKDVLTMGR